MPMLVDGFNTTITLPNAGAGIVFIEKEVTPPGMDAGGEIDQTAMRNTKWRTRNPKYLITLTKVDIKAKYDPFAYPTILAALGRNQLITVNFPSLTMATQRFVKFYGWLDKFMPEALKEGDEPLANIEIFSSNQNGGVETAPVFA